MSIFGTIMNKLGFGDKKAEAPAVAPAATTPVQTVETVAVVEAAPAVVAMSDVDVVTKLDGLAAENAQELNWKVSIVDLLKLLDIDSSLASRKELAKELGCPEDLMEDSASMNIWLHKTVLAQLAANGGNVPADLL